MVQHLESAPPAHIPAIPEHMDYRANSDFSRADGTIDRRLSLATCHKLQVLPQYGLERPTCNNQNLEKGHIRLAIFEICQTRV